MSMKYSMNTLYILMKYISGQSTDVNVGFKDNQSISTDLVRPLSLSPSLSIIQGLSMDNLQISTSCVGITELIDIHRVSIDNAWVSVDYLWRIHDKFVIVSDYPYKFTECP